MKPPLDEKCQCIKINLFNKISRIKPELNLNDPERFINCYIIKISKNEIIIIDPADKKNRLSKGSRIIGIKLQ